MPGALAHPVPGQGDVHRLLDQGPLVALGLQLFLPGGQGLADLAPRGPDPLARLGAGLRRQRADLGVGEGERRPIPGVREPRRLELIQAAGGCDGGERRVPHPGHLIG